jgi:hypothetical protein
MASDVRVTSRIAIRRLISVVVEPRGTPDPKLERAVHLAPILERLSRLRRFGQI